MADCVLIADAAFLHRKKVIRAAKKQDAETLDDADKCATEVLVCTLIYLYVRDNFDLHVCY